MTKLKHQSPPLLAIAIFLILTASAFGQEGEVVPPENPAVTQYTEPFPTAGGETDAHERKHRTLSTDRALGTRNAARLERQGAEGRAVAELAAETTPSTETAAAPTSRSGSGGGGSGSGRSRGALPTTRGTTADNRGRIGFDSSAVDGTSGLGTVLSGALGVQSGSAGLLLPFLLFAAIVAALIYAIRQRRAAG